MRDHDAGAAGDGGKQRRKRVKQLIGETDDGNRVVGNPADHQRIDGAEQNLQKQLDKNRPGEQPKGEPVSFAALDFLHYYNLL
ncbi:hypothetical protein PbDSM24746_49570 [Paenibacillus macerans]|nr:hypothetical protein PbDSM24746_49570 [Paenibacillus macerans]GBK71246.1 hypothetical protein PbJCM17693_49540 [Paenibacillus macerans]